MCHSPRTFHFCLALLALLAFGGPARAQTVYISEFLTENQTNTKVDEDGDHSDWLELWNSGATAVSLNGWFLTDDSANLHKWQLPVTAPAITLGANGRLLVFASKKDRKLALTKLHTNFKLSNSAGSYLALVRPDGLTIEHAYNGYPQQVQDISYGLPSLVSTQSFIAVGAAGKAKVPASAADMPTGAAGWNSIAYNDSAWQAGATGFGYDTTGSYGSLIGAGGNMQATMYQVNNTLLVRVPFTVANAAQVTALTLKMKYDDGFICYLNGNLIASSFSNGTSWNSSSLIDRNGVLISSYETFNPSNAQSFLVNGTNILAFHLQNYNSATDSDNFGTANGSRSLCLPLLDGTLSLGVGAPTYLASATPAAANGAALAALGPGVSQTTSAVGTRPTGDANSAPITVTAKVITTINPLAAASPVKLYYRVMFNAESNVVMKDDGLFPDLIANDHIYTAQIPTVNAGAAQMIRWRVEARDSANTAATEPPYRNTADNDQYYGTVTQDTITTSQLPILQWFLNPSFVTPTYQPGTSGGCRCSFFYSERNANGTYQPGRFYDNVQVDLHGQSTAGFPVNKKSHDVNFSQDNQFTWKTSERAVASFNLLTNYADKSKVRNNLAYETWAGSGHLASHFSIPVRVQQNGVFWGIYDLTENGNSDFLARVGLDSNGALYKMYDTFSDGGSSAEKKTGEPITDKSDLAAFENALNTTNALASRRLYGFDSFDVPTMINYLAVNDLIENNDNGHKNCYIYRDTYGSGEWSILPWDQDLSFGHTWTPTQGYFDDDIDAQRPLRNGADNRLKQLVWQSADLNAMYVRRMRTLMDNYLVSAAATNGPWETRINDLLNQLDPPAAGTGSDAYLDMLKWGYWTDGGGGNELGVGVFTANHFIRTQGARILNNNPAPTADFPGANPYGTFGYTSLPPFIAGRRQYLYTLNPNSGGVPIPAAQPAAPAGLVFEQLDSNPASGNQDHEYFILRNNSADYVDVSGWKITGAVSYTFRGGTVIPPFTSGSAVTATGDVHAGRLHVARQPGLFRLRTASPKGGEYRLVVGPYSGQLSARGETLNLVIPGATPAQDVLVATTTYAGTPTAAQNALRVTEINFDPAAPTTAELAALPGVTASDFEFIELINTGLTPLNIGGAHFDKGVTFTFPAGFTLQAGQRCVVVGLISAFNLRYSAAGAVVAGQYEGNLDNNGETVQLLDSVGESVLQFTYNSLWYGLPKPGSPSTLINTTGYSLVARTSNPAWDGYETASNWALADTAGGTPGSGETTFANVYVGWRKSYFSAAEEANPSIAGVLVDTDGDGRSNFEEFAFGGNPRVADARPQPVSSVVNVSGTDYLAMTYDRRHHTLDTAFTVEASSDLVTWVPVDLPVGSVTDLGNGMERVTYRDSQPVAAGQRFLRARATR